MQFSISLLALAASVSAAVVPRSDMGSWNIQMTLTPGEESLYLTTVFRSDAYSGDNRLISSCVEAPKATLPVAHRCDRAAFDFSYDGHNINLTQTVDLPTKMTVFGSAVLPEATDVGDGRFKLEATVEVSSAIA